MQKLLSLPESLVPVFHELTGYNHDWFVTADPAGQRVGSGGGTAWLLEAHRKQAGFSSFTEYLRDSVKLMIHAGGQGRRLPAYAPSGKVLAPVPVFRWGRGQKLDQTLLDLQVPLYERIMEVAGDRQHLLIASGDTLIMAPEIPGRLPEADVVCFGIWVDPHLASRHGVFFTPRDNPSQLEFMLQKPDHANIERLSASHLYLMDIGIWVLSDRATEILMHQCGYRGQGFQTGVPDFYDLYSTFGTALGTRPGNPDPEISSLTTAIIPLQQGEFYHYGTTGELITSSEKIQNRVLDQRNIWHTRIKPHPSLFVLNANTDVRWTQKHHHLWIENSYVPASWEVGSHHVITGIPRNDWSLRLDDGICLDMAPVGEQGWCIRPYGMEDAFKGKTADMATHWMGRPLADWFAERGIALSDAGLSGNEDIQFAPLFPVVDDPALQGDLVQWMTGTGIPSEMAQRWLSFPRLSADGISNTANLLRLRDQRNENLKQNLTALAANYKKSVFYQSDLKFAAQAFASGNLPLPEPLPESETASLRFSDHMFRSEVHRLSGLDGNREESAAFAVLRDAITGTLHQPAEPRLNVHPDQIVWGRSPARIDLAGGWSDTPPYCLQVGGSVLNMAVELNGQPPIQVYIRLCEEKKIMLRSIDNGISESVSTFEELAAYNQVGSAFSIPRAALCLAGFHPDFSGRRFRSLEDQLADFGGGFEISLVVAIPKGSGLGTSSILAASVLGALSDFCALHWDNQAICHRTLILEQLLTTGGGWQDQYGGILPGIKLLESEAGTQEKMSVHWMPDRLFTDPLYRDCWLLYYTGITRVAKSILSEIVRGMFLNEGKRLHIVGEIKSHAYALADAIQRSDFALTGEMIARSWKLNNALDSGTNTPEVQRVIDLTVGMVTGLKLAGAGGGGYMLMCARDPEAAARIRKILQENPLNARARFVKMDVSQTGFQTSRS
jgi:galactokinase/mevalonate kinase-like predicted kinase